MDKKEKSRYEIAEQVKNSLEEAGYTGIIIAGVKNTENGKAFVWSSGNSFKLAQLLAVIKNQLPSAIVNLSDQLRRSVDEDDN